VVAGPDVYRRIEASLGRAAAHHCIVGVNAQRSAADFEVKPSNEPRSDHYPDRNLLQVAAFAKMEGFTSKN
jgi:hypothetical protein